ncbi:aminotransferase class I/II-fold pyridoxal phosphate-dependent enzyme [Rarobacter faecitabidus]|uniref:homocysteine desulfhydrase n=1 Tax=Rarobacter faecitabidus TaxID=13243 RepID=A0A542ZX09_RARFA|nr:aminotransferase class I/II-fold pyridoxal phosphate-dependent enzyme [Rarobacter faecitabidus]TQL64888.1 cystathionine gamma-synthase [Rarobacter faecitabidus]
MTERELDPSTIVVSAGRPDATPGAPVNPPVVLSSTYVSTGTPSSDELLYTRWDTETWHPFEQAVAELERADLPGLVFSSGMAAISAVISLVPDGGTIVVPRHAYHATLILAEELAQRHGVTVRQVDVDDTEQVATAVVGADLVWIESPTNPMLEVADLPVIIEAAHAAGALVAVDNTFATPLVQRPLEFGADVVVHSVTKYLAGHSDVVLGLALTSDSALRERLWHHRTHHGAIAGPWEVWLALRGLRTLALRVERAQENARELALRLQSHANVVEVRHPSLPGDAGHEVATRIMRGYGSVIGLRPRGGATGADALIDALKVWIPATSLGGVESTLERRRRFTSESPTVPEDFIRMSVGIEHVEDLWADLAQGLDGL